MMIMINLDFNLYKHCISNWYHILISCKGKKFKLRFKLKSCNLLHLIKLKNDAVKLV